MLGSDESERSGQVGAQQPQHTLLLCFQDARLCPTLALSCGQLTEIPPVLLVRRLQAHPLADLSRQSLAHTARVSGSTASFPLQRPVILGHRV